MEEVLGSIELTVEAVVILLEEAVLFEEDELTEEFGLADAAL
jgi:hypothetical protein